MQTLVAILLLSSLLLIPGAALLWKYRDDVRRDPAAVVAGTLTVCICLGVWFSLQELCDHYNRLTFGRFAAVAVYGLCWAFSGSLGNMIYRYLHRILHGRRKKAGYATGRARLSG